MNPASPPAILIVDLAQHFGGADVRVLELARSLHGRYRYAVATLANSPLQQRLTAEGLNVLPVPFSRGDPRTLLYLWHLLRVHRFTVLDAHNPQSQFWGALAARLHGATSLVATVHSSYRAEHGTSPKGGAYEQVLHLNRLCGAQFIAVSESVHSYLRQVGVPESRLRLIYNSLRAPAQPLTRSEHPLLQSLGWDERVYLLITVARLEPVKGHTYLIEALRQVPDHPALRCLVVGDGRARPELEQQVSAAGLNEHVHFAGFRTDIADLLHASDAFCLASLTEGLPFALLEACLQELPLLLSQVGGMAELLTHRETAFLVPPAEPAALAEGIRWIIEQREAATRTGQAAAQLCQQRFSPEEMMSKTLDTYQPSRQFPLVASSARRSAE
jgi:glycosyltransferase involved in cell wall biosynthesis